MDGDRPPSIGRGSQQGEREGPGACVVHWPRGTTCDLRGRFSFRVDQVHPAELLGATDKESFARGGPQQKRVSGQERRRGWQ